MQESGTAGKKSQAVLVHQVRGWYSGAAAYFDWMREAKRENTRCGLRPMSDKAASQKTRSPEGCDENGPAAALLLGHVSIQICSFVAPCRRPVLIATPLYQSRTWCTRPIRLAAGGLLINCKICEKVRLAPFYAHKLSYEFIENSHRDHLGNDPIGEAIWNDRVAYFGSRYCECAPDGVPNHLGRIAACAFFK